MACSERVFQSNNDEDKVILFVNRVSLENCHPLISIAQHRSVYIVEVYSDPKPFNRGHSIN
jgi:hypothetical protein